MTKTIKLVWLDWEDIDNGYVSSIEFQYSSEEEKTSLEEKLRLKMSEKNVSPTDYKIYS